MIGIAKSRDDWDNYIFYRLRDFGLRWTEFVERLEGDLSKFHLLLISRLDLNQSEIENLMRFMENGGTVISIHPNEELVSLLGSYGKLVTHSEYPPSDWEASPHPIDHVLMFSIRIPIFVGIRLISEAQSFLKTENLNTPAIACKNFQEGSLYVFAYHLSDSLREIESYSAPDTSRDMTGVYHPTSFLEKMVFGLDIPYVDIQLMFLRERY